jgi:hypothetical protein
VAELAVDVPGEDPQADADLRCRQPGAAGGQHRLGEIGHQATQLGVEVDDRRGGRAEHGVAEQPDRGDAHRPIVCGPELIIVCVRGTRADAPLEHARGR